LLTISIDIRVSHEPEAVELLRRYNVALNYAINRILSLDLRSIGGFIMLYIENSKNGSTSHPGLLLTVIGMHLQMPRLGGIILGGVGGLGLGSLACYCTKARDTGLKKAMWRT
jgi:hypothetical protein